MAMKTMLMLLTVAIMATSIAEAQGPLGVVHVNGTLYCSHVSSFSGATQVTCSAGVIAHPPINATTNTNGVYLVVSIPPRNATMSSIVSNCHLFVLTPLSNCNPKLPSTGLVSSLKFVKTVPAGFWHTAYMVAAGFTLDA